MLSRNFQFHMATFCKELLGGLVEDAMIRAKEIAGDTGNSEGEQDRVKAGIEEDNQEENMEIGANGEEMEGIPEPGMVEGDTGHSEGEEDKVGTEEDNQNESMEMGADGEEMEGILEQGIMEGDDTFELESNEEEEEEEDAYVVEIGPKSFYCSVCNKHFEKRCNVQGHIKYVHTPVTDRKFICGTCPGRFVTPSDRDRHSETCRGPGVKRRGRRIGSKSNTQAARVKQALHHSRRNLPHPTDIRGWRLSNDQLLSEPFVKLQRLGKLKPEDCLELAKVGRFDLYA